MPPFGFLRWKKLNQVDSEESSSCRSFTFKELSKATQGFRPEGLIGEGGFGRVYKGWLESMGQVVAIEQAIGYGKQRIHNKVTMLSRLSHPNIIRLIGHCFHGDWELLVYEYMPLRSLEYHLYDFSKEPLDWSTRMMIAVGAAKGLEYVLNSDPPIIHRNFKPHNILLGEDLHPKLSDFGDALLGPVSDKSHISTFIVGTFGYIDPEYAQTGRVTVKTDIYSLGVVLLELITGRKPIHFYQEEQTDISSWVSKTDRKDFPKLADPRLQGRFPLDGLYGVLDLALKCTQHEPASRPSISDVVACLTDFKENQYNCRSPSDNPS